MNTTIPLTIKSSTVAGMRRAAQDAGVTLFHALAGAHAWWLQMYAESAEVVFSSAHGCATPTVVRCGTSDHDTFTALAGRIRYALASAHSDESHPSQDAGPMLNTVLLFESLAVGAASTTFDIRIDVNERPDGQIVGGFTVREDLYPPDAAHQMALHWCRVLDAVAKHPGAPMAEHDLLTAEERGRQLSWNPTTAEGISSRCVHELISSQIERTPDAVAVTAGDNALTYRELDDRAADIASWLVQAGARPGRVVALRMDRTPDVVAAILGVLKTGAAFLPLDPNQPAARNTLCINDVGADIVVTDRALGDLTPQATVSGALPASVSPSDLAYVICTSGSTGRPKPVLIEHRGATNLTRNLCDVFGIEAGDTVLSVASISFDMALFDIFSALSCGARVVLAGAAEAVSPAAMDRLIAASGKTFMFTTPTIWAALIAAGWAGDRRLMAAAGGEALTSALAEELLQRCGAVWNGYGPTEATAGTSMARLTPGEPITVGRPLPNVRAYVTDSRGRLQPIGVPGEIVIGGVGVGRGYLNRPAEQADRFGVDPFHPGGKIYRTGDRGRFLPDGRLQHLGRYDDQVKIRGCRIEPGEIESTLCEHPDVRACAVVAGEMNGGDKQLVAYLVGAPERLGAADTRAWLRRRLPEYMIPGAFVHLRALPMTPNGKLDKAALPAAPPRQAARVGARPPRTDLETRVAALWTDLLGAPVTDVSSDFFDLGGHSLLAARLISEVEQTFGVALSLESFIDSGRVVAKLAELLSAEKPSNIRQFTSQQPLHFIFSDLPSAMSLRHFSAQWGLEQPVHALVPEQPGGRFDRSVSIEEHARQALAAIRRRQPAGSLALAGFSIGGLVAYEVARQAVDAGLHVEWLGIVDAVAPPLRRAQLTLRWRLRSIRRRPARERLKKCAKFAFRSLKSRLPLRGNEFDYRGVTEIGRRYHQLGHQVPVHLFVSEISATTTEDDMLGWREFHQGSLTGHLLAGGHADLLRQPEVKATAQKMLESLHASKDSVRCTKTVTVGASSSGGRCV